ncbi:hypothetical protein [Actinomadura chibensis]|uniref:DUF5129 domain-containing protein n=1 Tax=Actinomadura chibensis TaxID=392828 RepID=A0A5D0NM19_9ACTN|nr:hypothetical protein [Actinomadura chibensis]TYB45543.1 hypothetical protein FXF69_19135 [Actinomadura chibensis]
MRVRVLFLWLLCTVAFGTAISPAMALTSRSGNLTAPEDDPAPSPSATTTTVGAGEARKVYCLSRAQWPELVDAIAALNLGERPSPVPSPSASAAPGPDQILVGGRLTDLRTWSRLHPEEFARACDAVVKTAAPPKEKRGGGLFSGIPGWLLPLLAGAVLTMFTTELRGAIDRGRALAGTLRELTDAYLAEADAVLTEAEDEQLRDETLRSCAAATAALRRHLEEVAVRRAWWWRVRRLIAALEDGSEHTEPLTRRPKWRDYQGDEKAADRAAFCALMRARLADMKRELMVVARNLERPRPHPLLWVRPGRVK